MQKSSTLPTECTAQKRPFLVGVCEATNTAIVKRANCGQWSCPYCGAVEQSKWQARAIHGGEFFISQGCTLSFITLTVRPTTSIAQSERIFSQAWPKLRKRVQRKVGEKLEYMAVTERHKSGKTHMHVIGNHHIPSHWWHGAALQAGLGYMAKAKPVTNGYSCGRYIGKYLSKTLSGNAWPSNFRRVRVSQNWPALPERLQQQEWKWQTFLNRQATQWEVYILLDEGYSVVTYEPSIIA